MYSTNNKIWENMKILFLAPYVTIEGHSQFTKNRTGFGYIVFDIAKYLAKKEKVDIITISAISKKIVCEGISLLSHTWEQIFSYFKINSIDKGVAFLKKYPVPNSRKIKILYYFFNEGYLEKAMQKGSYDFVHIHGCTTLSLIAIDLCTKHKIPFLITLHGLNSFSDSVMLNSSEKQYERDFLQWVAKGKIPVSFISSRDLITVEEFVKKKCSNFYLINNGCDVEEKPFIENIRKKYSINHGDFVFVFAGNIAKHKNQIQACRAYILLPPKIKEQVKILFVGGLHYGSEEVINYINIHHLENSLIICGTVDRGRVCDYYQAANATMLLSVSEGFGLSIIEGFVYGLPNLTFYDLGAVNDVYNSEAMIVVEDRNDKTLAEAMLQMMRQNWNKEKIKRHSQELSLNNMADKYFGLYYKIIKESNGSV